MKAIKKLKDSGIFVLIFGLLIIALNYMNVTYIRNYSEGIFYFAMYFVGIIGIAYGLYRLVIRK